MAHISEEEINSIRDRANIVDVISKYISLSKSGSDYVGICPFHDDHSPSMHVSTKLGLFKCFVCGTGGNVFSFVQKYENISYLEAVKTVAEQSGIDFKYALDTHHESVYKKEFETMDLSLKYYQNNLYSKEGTKAKEYLHQRGITDDIIKEFKIGLSLSDNGLYKLLDNKKYDLDTSNKIGLLNKSGINYYDMFQDRIMIPLIDMQGNLAGYTARAYLKDEKNKYINSKESIIYHKSDMLFNYYNAKNDARANKEVIIVEGNMDAISLSSAGIKNVVALMGVVISPKQIEYLRKLNARVVLMLDSDNAGTIATNNVGDSIYDAGLDLYVVRLSGAKDPDEYIRKYSKDALLDNIKHAKKYLDFKIDLLKDTNNLNDATGQTEYIRGILELLKNSSDIEKDVVLSKISKDYGLDLEMLKKNVPIKEVSKKTEVIKDTKRLSRYELAVNSLIYAMLLNKEYITIFNDKNIYLKNKMERDITTMIYMYIEKNNRISIAEFLDYTIKYPEIHEYLENIIAKEKTENVTNSEFCGILMLVDKCIKDEEIKKLKEKIKNELDSNKQLELINELMKLKKDSGIK